VLVLVLVQQRQALVQEQQLLVFYRKRPMQQRPTKMLIRGSFSFQFLD
jgi:hypothetical protein